MGFLCGKGRRGRAGEEREEGLGSRGREESLGRGGKEEGLGMGREGEASGEGLGENGTRGEGRKSMQERYWIHAAAVALYG